MNQELRETLAEFNEEMILADGLDGAIIGVGQRGALSVALYDAELVIAILRTELGMEEEEAREHFDYNILGSWMGEYTPMFCHLLKDL